MSRIRKTQKPSKKRNKRPDYFELLKVMARIVETIVWVGKIAIKLLEWICSRLLNPVMSNIYMGLATIFKIKSDPTKGHDPLKSKQRKALDEAKGLYRNPPEQYHSLFASAR
jgi:hypothetical protein